jgi:uncharacterized protein
LRNNPAIEINFVDPMVRKGYRFKGTAIVISEGERFRELPAFYERECVADVGRRIRAIVLVKVERALPLVSPAYDGGATEDETRAVEGVLGIGGARSAARGSKRAKASEEDGGR